MQIVEIEISKLKDYENNPRHNNKAVDAVSESIKNFGFKVPVIIDKDYIIVAGHTRKRAAKKLGLKTVPCIIADDLTPEQIKAFRLADNKTAELADWDFDKLEAEIKELQEMEIDFSMEDFGFDLSEFEEPTELEEDDFDVDEEAEAITEPVTKLGDIWQLGNHRLMCGSATNVDDIEKLIGNNKIDFVNCDPPYGMSAVSKSGVLSKTYKTDIMNDDTNQVAIDSFNLAISMFKEAKHVWWGANYYTECLPSAECWIVWDKNNGGSDQTDCELAWTNFRSVVRQFTLASEKTNRVHPTQKPLKLLKMILDKFDKKREFNSVLDLFGGSGSTLIVCQQLGLRNFTMELDPKFCDVIIKRWETLTGKKAELIND